MANLLNAARAYVARGLSVIPVQKTKKPALKSWSEYMTRLPTDDELIEWFGPAYGIGIVAGPLSGIGVVDVDGITGINIVQKALGKHLETPISKTPKGYHIIFKYDKALDNSVNKNKEIDTRGDGGYIVAAPTPGYSWLPESRSILKLDPIEVPDVLVKVIRGEIQGAPTPAPAPMEDLIPAGERDDKLFHFLWTLKKGGATEEELQFMGKLIAQHGMENDGDEPDPDVKVTSALKRAAKMAVLGVSERIHEFVSGLEDDARFSIRDMFNELGLVTTEDKRSARSAVKRLIDKRVLVTLPQPGHYQKPNQSLRKMDLSGPRVPELDLRLPLGLNEMARVLPNNLVIVAGEPNVGKSAFLLDIAARNMGKWSIDFFSSEADQEEIKDRLQHSPIPISKWQKEVAFYERSENFDQVTYGGPNKLIFIDFLEMHNEFYRVGEFLLKIWQRLQGGVAVVAIQKRKNSDLPVGGGGALEKTRLLISLEWPGICHILKAKLLREGKNVTHQARPFKLVNGVDIRPCGKWDNIEVIREMAEHQGFDEIPQDPFDIDF